MSARSPNKIKLIVGLFSNDARLLKKTKGALRSIYGPIDYESPVLDFSHTAYYQEEFGDNLKRIFVSFEKLLRLKNIYKVKLKTNGLERKVLSKSGSRTVNIDPGYLDLSKLVLLSTKDYSHRVYMDKGIFAEVTLFYKDGTYNPWPWTYPDYKTKPYIDIFNSIRELYKNNLKGGR